MSQSRYNDIIQPKANMTNRTVLLWLSSLAMGFSMLGAESESTLNPHLEVLRPLLGKTWKGTFNDSKPEKPTIDVARWERALNGQAVRLLHSINQGMYGGETLFVWNQKTQQVEYFYFTTAGYMTTGTMTAKDGRIDTR